MKELKELLKQGEAKLDSTLSKLQADAVFIAQLKQKILTKAASK